MMGIWPLTEYCWGDAIKLIAVALADVYTDHVGEEVGADVENVRRRPATAGGGGPGAIVGEIVFSQEGSRLLKAPALHVTEVHECPAFVNVH